jgi:uncharacterized membrane protein YhaH (DUF805 family)
MVAANHAAAHQTTRTPPVRSSGGVLNATLTPKQVLLPRHDQRVDRFRGPPTRLHVHERHSECQVITALSPSVRPHEDYGHLKLLCWLADTVIDGFRDQECVWKDLSSVGARIWPPGAGPRVIVRHIPHGAMRDAPPRERLGEGIELDHDPDTADHTGVGQLKPAAARVPSPRRALFSGRVSIRRPVVRGTLGRFALPRVNRRALGRLRFRLDSRIDRRTFWIALTTIALGWALAMQAAIHVRNSSGPSLGLDGFAIVVAVAAIGLVAYVSIKRWHDRDKSGWWVFAFFIPLFGPAWTIIEPGFIAGSPGQNRFGPEPRPSRSGRRRILTTVYIVIGWLLVVSAVQSFGTRAIYYYPVASAAPVTRSGIAPSSGVNVPGQYVQLAAPYDRSLVNLVAVVQAPRPNGPAVIAALNQLSVATRTFSAGLLRLPVNEPTTVDIQALVDANNGILESVRAFELHLNSYADGVAVGALMARASRAAALVRLDLGIRPQAPVQAT